MKYSFINKLKNSKYLITKLNEGISYLILFISLMINSLMLKKSYSILGFNYGLIITLYLLTLAFYNILGKIASKGRKRIFFILVITLVVCGMVILEFSNITQWIINATRYYHQIYNAIIHSEDIYYYQIRPFLIAFIPAFTILMLYTFSKGRFEFLFVFNILFAAYLWYQGYDNEIKPFLFLMAFVNIIVYCLNTYNINTSKYKKLKIKVSISKGKILIYSLVIAFISSGFSFTVIGTLGVKSIPELTREIRSQSKAYVEKSKRNRYDLTSSGYYENQAKLGGPIYLNNELAMKVKSDAAYYLRGNTKEMYDGHSWKRAESAYTKKLPNEAANTQIYFLDHLKSIKDGNISKIDLERKHLFIYPQNISTSTLFAPNFTYDINSKDNYIGVDKSVTFILLNKTVANEGYRVDFNSMKDSPETFEKLYAEHVGIFYNTSKHMTADEKDYYDKKIKNVYKDYLQLPNNLSPEIYSMVDNIIKDCKNTSEKVIKIQEYLRSNFTYSLDVSEVPKNDEFLHYFLFKEKKGYCTYFATAATIFCRIAGIPSRYVEGFHMKEGKDMDGYYEVTNDMAHAWTEVLLDPEKNLWSTVDSVPAYEEELAKERNILMAAGRASLSRSKVLTSNGREDVNIDIKDKMQSGDKTVLLINKINVLFYIVITILLFVLCYIIIRLYKFKKIKKLILTSKSFIPLYCYSKGRIGILGYKQDKYLGDKEWINSVDDEELRRLMGFITRIAYEEFYGQKGSYEIDRYSIYNLIEGYISRKQNAFKYLFFKIFKDYSKHIEI